MKELTEKVYSILAELLADQYGMRITSIKNEEQTDEQKTH